MIVFADDHDDIRFAVHRVLQRAGHRMVLAADGAAGWQAVRRHRPHLVVTDVDMPGMTGLQLCRAIREDADLRHIPVVLATGSPASRRCCPRRCGSDRPPHRASRHRPPHRTR